MTTSSSPSLLPAEVRRALDRLRFEVKRVPPGGRRAERNSRQRGAGIEFVDFRGYVPGDDFRALDWHAYVRHNKLVLKQFEEQQDLPVYVLFDASASMREPIAGTNEERRFPFAKQLAAAFCYVGLANQDRVHVLPFADAPLPSLRPLSGRKLIGRMTDFLQRLSGGKRTHLALALERFIGRAARRGVVVLISDFFTQDDLAAARDALKRMRHEVAVVLIDDAEEVNALPDGDLLLEDCETGESIAVTITPESRAAYAKSHERFVEDIAVFCRRAGVAFARARVGASVAELVADIVRQQGLRGWARNQAR